MPEPDQRLPQRREACVPDSRLQLVDSAFTHGWRTELRAREGGESRSRGALFFHGAQGMGRTRERERTLTRDTIGTLGACALMFVILFTCLTELPLIWIADAIEWLRLGVS